MPCAPGEVFLLATKSICTSSAAGFQDDSLALGAVVKLVQRALADHREIFQDKTSDCLEALLNVVDLFVEAGWPQARQVTYACEVTSPLNCGTRICHYARFGLVEMPRC
jgi:hypothetical protein